MMTRRTTSGLSMLAGTLLGAVLMLVGLAQAGRLAPSRPEVLVALAQTLEVEHQHVDLLLKQKDIAGAIAALEALRKLEWPTRETAGESAEQLRHAARQSAARPHARLALHAPPAVLDALRADPAALAAYTARAGHPISLCPGSAPWHIEEAPHG